MIDATKARVDAIRAIEKQIDAEDLDWLDDEIRAASKAGRFFINVHLADQLPNTTGNRHLRTLLEYLKLKGYNAYFVGTNLEIKWQI
ncbi:hypothetical protein VPHD527_0081 [Vibrio phage D527]